MKIIKPEKGRLLISEPNMLDSNFKRSILLLTEHNEKESIGFILNQPTKIKIHDLFEEFPSFDANVHVGGPVEKNTLHYIHSLGNRIDGSIQIHENLYWSGNFEMLKELIKNKEITPSDVRFFVGYSGWSTGQLDHELEENAWIVSNEDPKFLFDKNNNNMWREFIRKMDKEYAIWSNMPEDPELN
jgi:putative transcriptional regulator